MQHPWIAFAIHPLLFLLFFSSDIPHIFDSFPNRETVSLYQKCYSEANLQEDEVDNAQSNEEKVKWRRNLTLTGGNEKKKGGVFLSMEREKEEERREGETTFEDYQL